MFPNKVRTGWLCLLASVLSVGATNQNSSPPAPLPGDPNQFVREMVKHELDAQDSDHTRWRFRYHKETEGSAQDRDVIQTREGSLSKTVLINGQPLNAEDRSKDEARMK